MMSMAYRLRLQKAIYSTEDFPTLLMSGSRTISMQNRFLRAAVQLQVGVETIRKMRTVPKPETARDRLGMSAESVLH